MSDYPSRFEKDTLTTYTSRCRCPLFDIDYCGDSKQVACKKLQELLKLNVAAEHVKLVLFGGREDSAHINLLTALKAAGTEKLMLIGMFAVRITYHWLTHM